MAELEDKVVRELLNDGTLKFYTRFVDDTLLLMKKEDVERVKTKFENFDKNLKFTYELFEDENPHFLDIEISPIGLNIYRKDTFTGHYTNFSSFVPWSYRISWIRSLIYRSKRICDPALFKEAVNDIKKFASWNGFPRKVRNQLVNKFVHSRNEPKTTTDSTHGENLVYFDLPYIGPSGEKMVKSFKKKIQRLLTPSK